MQSRKFKITGFITKDTKIFDTTVGRFSELVSREFEKQFALLEAHEKNSKETGNADTNTGK